FTQNREENRHGEQWVKKRLVQPCRDKRDQQRREVRYPAVEEKTPEPQKIEREMRGHCKRCHARKQHLAGTNKEQQGNDRRFRLIRLKQSRTFPERNQAQGH